MDKLFDKFFDVLTIISDGGPKAIIAILFVGMVLVITANYFLVKFMIKFFEKMNETRDKLIAEKDAVIKERVEKLEELVVEYNKSSVMTADAIRKLETSVHELFVLVQTFVTSRNNRR